MLARATALTEEQFAGLNPMLGTLRLPYCPVEPTAKQEYALLVEALEVFFGGAAGPGKSWWLLMSALQYADVAGYHALLLRPSLTDFEQPGGLVEVSHSWLDGSDAYWHGGLRRWSFPSKATVRFGYLATSGDIEHYKGAAVSFIGFDELTSFPESLYRAMFRLLRQPRDVLKGVPVRARAASNPGGIGHAWVKSRFVSPKTRERGAVFVPARLRDNPHLDIATYLESLAHLHPVDRQRLVDGDWDISEEGSKFRRESFPIVPVGEVAQGQRALRYWDLAGTEPTASNPDPDRTVGLLYEVDGQGFYAIRDVVVGQWADHDVETIVRQTAAEDGRGVPVYIEQDPGQAGKAQLSNYRRHVLAGFACHSGSTRINGRNEAKEVRARPVAAAAGNGLVRIVEGCRNLREFLDELAIFPNGAHDDCVDALSGAHNAITDSGTGRYQSMVARGTTIPTGADRRPGL